MKSYDLVYVVRPDLEAEALKAVVERMSQRIAEQGGTVEAVDVWGKKRMTFTVKKYREGVFVHTRFALAPGKVEEVRRVVALTEDVLRSVMTNAVGKLPEARPTEAVPPAAGAVPPAAEAVPPAAATPAPQERPAEASEA